MAGVSASASTVRPGSTASAKAPGRVPSTSVTSMPKRGQTEPSSCRVPPYIWRWATMWLPRPHRPSTTPLIAPMPEAKASAASAPSSAATASSNARTVGLPWRV